MENRYEKMSLAQLKEEAKSYGLKGTSTMRKGELAALLLDVDNKREELVRLKREKNRRPRKEEVFEDDFAEIISDSDNKTASTEDAVIETDTAETTDTQQGRSENVREDNSGRSYDGHQAENRSYGNRSYDGRQGENRPNGQYENRPNGQYGQYENRPNGQYGQYENRPNGQNGQYENRPNSQNGQYENRSNGQYDNRRPADDAAGRTAPYGRVQKFQPEKRPYTRFGQQPEEKKEGELDSGETKTGILEVLPEGFGFIRCDNYLPGDNDVYVSPMQIRKYNLKTGDIVIGNTKVKTETEKFSALLYVTSVNGFSPAEAIKRGRFEDLTPIFPDQRLRLEVPGNSVAMRMVDLVSPIGKGQRGMIVSQPKTGKTTLLKQIAKSLTHNYPELKLIILLIDERPEEVTDIKESIMGKNVEVIYSTFDELPENHKRVSEMVIERGKRLVEHKQDVVILLDSITRLARAYNLTVAPSGRTLSGGLDPAALHMPKKFFGAARNMREGGSLTILSTALIDTGSRMDDVVFEEFKGTGNMELVLDRSLSEKKIFPAINLARSSTRRDDLLFTEDEAEASLLMRRALSSLKGEEALERILQMFKRTRNNAEFIDMIKKTKFI